MVAVQQGWVNQENRKTGNKLTNVFTSTTVLLRVTGRLEVTSMGLNAHKKAAAAGRKTLHERMFISSFSYVRSGLYAPFRLFLFLAFGRCLLRLSIRFIFAGGFRLRVTGIRLREGTLRAEQCAKG